MELARRQENEDGGQELRRELKTHRACEPDGGFQTYLEERRKKEILA